MAASKRVYKTFIDDSGEKEYGPATSRYFVYAAVLIETVSESAIIDDMRHLKIYNFCNHAVEIKSTWLRQPEQRQRRYLAPYRLSDVELKESTERIHDWIATAPIVLVASVVDKNKNEGKIRR